MGINQKGKRGFTFVEMLIVIAILGIALPALFSVLFVIVRQQNKIYRLSEVKRQGDYALNVIINTIRNHAAATYSDSSLTTEVCSSAGESATLPYFQDKNTATSYFRYSFSANKIASASSVAGASGDLTGGNIVADTTGGVALVTCERQGDFSPPTVFIRFTLCYESCSLTRPEDTASMNFSARVGLRNIQ